MSRPQLHRAALRSFALAALTLSAAAHAQSLSYLGQQIVATGSMFGGTTIGGLSGIDYLASTNSYVSISDDRSGINAARYYGLSLDISKFVRSGTPGDAGVQFQSVTTIRQADGTAFPTNGVDPESIRVNPVNGNLIWSNEGQRAAGAYQNPTVREMTTSGSYVRDFAVPTRYSPVGSVGGTSAGDSGIYNNLAFESLTVSSDHRTLYTATENALTQDGPTSSVTTGSPSRILSFDLATGKAGAEYVYGVTPVVLPPNPAGGFATNGLVDFVATGDRQFITLERSFAAGAASPGVGPNGLPTGYSVRLYAVDARNATDVSGLDSLVGASFTSATKTLLLDLGTLRNLDGSALALDNLEGLTLGPIVNGVQTLILVSDNNFGDGQFTQFIALGVSPVPEPAMASLSVIGLLGLAWKVRAARRKTA